MKALLLLISLAVSGISGKDTNAYTVSKGAQPELATDSRGTVRMVFGRNDSIFYSFSKDKGAHFSAPQLITRVTGMHLGMTRGPQIASSDRYTMITAMDKKGTIHSFLIDQVNGKLVRAMTINDLPFSAPEGLMGLAADQNDHFYAVWLDTRINKRNNIFFSSFSAKDNKWSANKLVYQSPEGHTCECCKPNIAVRGAHIAIMFRNWINGSRDLYYTESLDKGATFAPAKKLGEGTWKLDGCPMDGGGITIDNRDKVHTVWQRNGVVYYCVPGQKETELGKGRSCSITSNDKSLLITYQEGNTVKLLDLANHQSENVGEGSYIKAAALPDNSVVCAWEEDKEVKCRKL